MHLTCILQDKQNEKINCEERESDEVETSHEFHFMQRKTHKAQTIQLKSHTKPFPKLPVELTMSNIFDFSLEKQNEKQNKIKSKEKTYSSKDNWFREW